MDTCQQASVSREHPKKTAKKQKKHLSVTVADIFTAATFPSQSDDDSEDIHDVIEENYYCDALEDLEEQYSRAQLHKPPRASGGKRHVGVGIQVVCPHKWKQAMKREEEVKENCLAAKKNIAKQLEDRGLALFGHGIYEQFRQHIQSQLQDGDRQDKWRKKCRHRKALGRSGHDDKDSPVVLRHALKKSDVSRSAASHLCNIVDMQHRDITPEDYDLLLQLDQDVACKTVSQEVIERLKTDSSEQLGVAGEQCCICMEWFEGTQLLKTLSCGHYFHSQCVDRWLTYSSCACPLDGLPLVQ